MTLAPYIPDVVSPSQSQTINHFERHGYVHERWMEFVEDSDTLRAYAIMSKDVTHGRVYVTIDPDGVMVE